MQVSGTYFYFNFFFVSDFIRKEIITSLFANENVHMYNVYISIFELSVQLRKRNQFIGRFLDPVYLI